MKVKEFLKTLKGKIIVSVMAVLCLVVIMQYPASTGKVFKEYKATYDVSVINKHYDGKGLFGWLEDKKRKEVVEMALNDINNSIMASTGGTAEDINNVEIENVSIERKSYSSDYVDIETTIKNNSNKSIRYIKINLHFKDSKGNIVKSEWTNDSATIKQGANQIVSKMTLKDGWTSVSAEIDEVKFK